MGKLTKAQQAERDEAIGKLRKICKPGTRIYTVVRHVAKSGMSRHISLLVADCTDKDRPINDITWYVGRALGYRRHDRDGGLIVGGCGMDMGFHLVHSLSYALHGMGDVGDDAKEAGTKGRPFTPRKGQYRGGYSLTHEWI
jgi:hypothetical protein